MGTRFGQQYRTYDDLQEANSIVVGNPDTVTRKLTEIVEDLHPGYLIVYGNEGDMPHEKVMRSIELFATKVMPHFKEVPVA